MKVAICTPVRDSKPVDAYTASLEAEAAILDGFGFEHGYNATIRHPYISVARATMLTKALKWGADVVCFVDDDVSWQPGSIAKLIQTEGDVVAGCYRYKKDAEEYMGQVNTASDGVPVGRYSDGAISADRVPGGFLKVTRHAVEQFKQAYPALIYGVDGEESVDLFNHGAYKGMWWGEDYAFSRNWANTGGKLWIVPDLNLTHHGRGASGVAYPGNFHEFLLRCPRPELAA